MYRALYRTYRPETFDAILGQEHIVKILKNQIKQGTVGHAYLFCGTRGTGKTSTARILAKGLNCTADQDRPCGQCSSCIDIRDGIFMDVIEIDAASNNGVDNIRELRESVKYPPVSGKTKVYIIDEVHMLSSGAFNALLKTLEEPPEKVIFVLATTEPQKLPATILSRCLKLDFKRVSEGVLKDSIQRICAEMGVEITSGATGVIAANADGSVRDCLSLLDQCLAAGDRSISREDVLEILGTSGEEVFIEITDFIIQKDLVNAFVLLNKVLEDGKDVRQFIRDWISHFRNLLMTKFIKNPEDVIQMSIENVERIREQAHAVDLEEINHNIIELSKTSADAKWSTQPRILLELCMVRLTEGSGNASVVHASPIQHCPKVLQEKPSVEPAVEKKPVEKPTVKEAGQLQRKDYSEIWHRVFEQGETEKASYNLIRTGTVLLDITENNFIVSAKYDMILQYLQNNKKELEEIMERLMGYPLKMECKVGEHEMENEAGPQVEDLAGIIGSKLGLNIEIE